jgi:hypothetical protein
MRTTKPRPSTSNTTKTRPAPATSKVTAAMTSTATAAFGHAGVSAKN